MADQTTLLLEMVRQLRDDYARDQEQAQQSRASLHRRVDEVIDRIGKIETTAALAGEIDAQVRVELDALNKKLIEVEPVAEEWGRVKTIGKWAAGALLASGVGLGAVAAALGDQAIAAVRHWLRID